MYDAAELQNILPRVHQALLHRNTRALWRALDRTARLMWCSLAHLDPEVYAAMSWEQLNGGARCKLDIAINFAERIFNRLAELAPTRD